ncbi:hypothetical protein [Paraburkholderia sp. J11-2]|uniref:hypothetical protein n=1 Tax=Paraburkholderia sp. J11-2 TaxID=2805431 RepID=UPI002AB7C86D|nr:hypothetical protein [Paraburkholderia sp. J11-2]
MKYFISYRASKGAQDITGRCDFSTTEAIHSSARVDFIEDTLKRDYGYDSLTVTFWRRYEEE